MSKTICTPSSSVQLTPLGTVPRLGSSSSVSRRNSAGIPRSVTMPRSAAVSGIRSSLVFAAASVASAIEEIPGSSAASAAFLETTMEMPREILDSELAPLPAAAPPKVARRPLTTRSLITPDVAASAAASAAAFVAGYTGTVPTTTVEVVPAPRQVVPLLPVLNQQQTPPPRSLSPIKTAPVLAYQGIGALPAVEAPARAQRSAATREAFVAFSSFACVGAMAAFLASGLLSFSGRPVYAKEATAAPQVITASLTSGNVADTTLTAAKTVAKSATATAAATAVRR